MTAPLVVLTGAAGGGKTTIARAVEKAFPSVQVERFDSIGVPSLDVMNAFGIGCQPGGAWQRAMTLQWIGRLEPALRSGQAVLLEGQIRCAFIEEATTICRLSNTRPILITCDNAVRAVRLRTLRVQPELVNENTFGWADFLHEEALSKEYEIIDTGRESTADTVVRLGSYLAR